MWAIEDIISTKSVKVLLQPIISIKKKSVLGYEALSRGIDNNGQLISAFDLFESAKAKDKLLELDNLCREIAIEQYKDILKEKHLFLNYEISDLNKGDIGKKNLIKSLNHLNERLEELNISNNKIIIEIIESKVKDLESLKFFTELCKSYGFLIALDDVGSGHSNLNRIPLLKPNIIKIDRYLVTNINKDYYKQEVFKSITSLSRMIGTLVISEGVETEEEAISSIELRADMIQGYYFSKPSDIIFNTLDQKIELLYHNFKKYFMKKTLKSKSNNRVLLKIIRTISKTLQENFENGDYNSNYKIIREQITNYLKEYKYIECIYLINSDGRQISETFIDNDIVLDLDRNLFSPATKGDDHSLKQYFYQLKISHSNHYISTKYVSIATGNRCKTISAYINENIIIAMDINYKIFPEKAI